MKNLKLSIAALGIALFSTLSYAQECVYQEENGFLLVQMESAQPVGDWELETIISGYTHEGYFRWNGPNNFNKPGEGVFSFDFNISPENGGKTFNFDIRNYHDHPDPTEENDVWVRMDGGKWIKVYSGGNKAKWNCNTNHEFSHSDKKRAKYTLAAGKHTIQFSGRSKNYRMDRWTLWLPNGQGNCNANLPESECGGEKKTVGFVNLKEILCHGDATGEITAILEGGGQIDGVLWKDKNGNNVGDKQRLRNASVAGSPYTVLLEVGGDIVEGSYSFTQPTKLLSPVVARDITCNRPFGIAKCAPKGGVAPYTYAWSNGSIINVAMDLTAGLYSCRVTDANGCVSDNSIEIKNRCNKLKEGEVTGIDVAGSAINHVRMFPNPVGGNKMLNVRVEVAANNQVQLVLMNLLGETILSSNHPVTDVLNTSVDLNGVKEGIYFIQVVADGKVTKTSRVVVQ